MNRPRPGTFGSARRFWILGLDVVFLLSLATYVACGRGAAPFHGDESTFIWMSHDYDFLVRDGSPEAVAFSVPARNEYAQWLRVLNGSLTPLAIGATRHAAGHSGESVNKPWIWELPPQVAATPWRANVAAGRLPDGALLRIGRFHAVVLTAASIGLVFMLALALSNQRLAAWVATALYATTPAVLLWGRRATQEGALLFTTALGIAVTLWALHGWSRSGRGEAPLCGLLAVAAACGLALAAKHSAVLMVAAGLLALLVAPVCLRASPSKTNWTAHIASIVGTGFLILAVFQLAMPVWWSFPRTLVLAGFATAAFSLRDHWTPRRTRILQASGLALIALAVLLRPDVIDDAARIPTHLFELRQALIARQSERYATNDSLAARLETLLRESLGSKAQYFEDPAWSRVDETSHQIRAYRESGLAGRPTGVLPSALLGVLVALGLWSLRSRWRHPDTVLLLAWLGIPALVMLANPLPWQRYYLVFHAPVAILAGLGAAQLRAAFPRREQ